MDDRIKKIQNFLMMLDDGILNEEDCLHEIKDVITHGKEIKRSEAWNCLKSMPPLYHKLPNQDFSYENSEVLKWLGNQKEALGWLVGSAYKNKYLKYDKGTGKWQGVDYKDEVVI